MDMQPEKDTVYEDFNTMFEKLDEFLLEQKNEGISEGVAAVTLSRMSAIICAVTCSMNEERYVEFARTHYRNSKNIIDASRAHNQSYHEDKISEVLN